MRFLPGTVTPSALLIVGARGLRAIADGCISVVLPAWLLALGFDAFQVGLLTTATLLGSALLTLIVGLHGSRAGLRTLLLAASALMAATGCGFAAVGGFWPLLLVAFVGTLNPSAGDVSVFLPLEQAALSGAVADRDRTDLFARYSLVGSLLGAAGTLLAIVPDWLGSRVGADRLVIFQATFLAYAAVGVVTGLIYRRLPVDRSRIRSTTTPLGPSRGIVFRLAALFSVDAFAGGLVVQSLMALWLFDTFRLSVAATAQIFFATNLLSAFSYLVAARIARRIGLINTMVFTHLPANVCLMIVPFVGDLRLAIGLLLLRGLLSQMDVPTRTSYVMAVVTPLERPAAAGVTAVPRSLASALGPTLGGYLLAVSGGFGWPLFLGGALKAAYDITLLFMFRHVSLPEEQ
jgi:MFS family permease